MFIHESVKSSNPETRPRKYTKKTHWSNDNCTIARDRQRFWYRIWAQCEVLLCMSSNSWT